MNDTLLQVEASHMATPLDAGRFDKVSFDYILGLGRELFSEEPLLAQKQPERARRLAWLMAMKHPDINAALFVAPARGCPGADVTVRFCSLPIDLIAQLHSKSEAGLLDAVSADRAVWRRLAA